MPGTDLMLLHPDGSEEVLVEGGEGAVADPFVSFDGEWVYYAKFHDQSKQPPWGLPPGGVGHLQDSRPHARRSSG